jgi:TENA/THI-4/PQQC family
MACRRESGPQSCPHFGTASCLISRTFAIPHDSAVDSDSAIASAGDYPSAVRASERAFLHTDDSSTEAAATSDSLIDAGMRGDLLALKVALVPCVIGYAEIATRLATRPDAHAATNRHRAWINAHSDMFTFRAALRSRWTFPLSEYRDAVKRRSDRTAHSGFESGSI